MVFYRLVDLSVTEYVKFAKIERAKVLLKSTDQTVQGISASFSIHPIYNAART